MKQLLHIAPHTWLGDIRFWIIVFFVLRLYGITLPPAEVGHAWRQVTVNMVARNFLETSPDIFYPRVDFAGEKTGITGMEFPLLNYLIYLISLLFGFDHWYGRIINLAVSSVGIFFFYRLVRRYMKERVAFFAALILLSSIWFNYSRKIMPDTFSMSLVLTGLYTGLVYLEKGKMYRLAFFGILVLAGILAKLPSLVMVPVLLFPLLNTKLPLNRRSGLALVTLVVATAAAIWYFYWVPYLVRTYGFWHFYMGNTFAQVWQEILGNPGDTFRNFYFSSLYSYAGFAAFIAGLVIAFIRKEKAVIYVFLLLTVFFAVFIIKAGFNFPHHNYYIIPYVPLMAWISGYLISQIHIRWLRYAAAILVMAEGIINQQHDFRIKPENRYLLTLEKAADRVSRPDELIIINGGISPVDIYFTHRKGWTSPNEDLFSGGLLEEVSEKGCTYFFSE